MPSKSLNRSLHAARASKQDDFYTQLSDIEKELRHYTTHFEGKTVLCNCDDPRVSNFFHYFNRHFKLDEMEGDHVKPGQEGGKTNAANCQMLCKDDNRRKSGR